MQVLFSQDSKIERDIKPRIPARGHHVLHTPSSFKVFNTQNAITQPIKYIQHFPVFKKRRYKVLKYLDLKVSPSLKFQKVKRVLKNVKYIAKARLDYNPQKNFEYLYTIFSRKTMALEVEKLTHMPPEQRDLIIRRLREFRYVNSFSMADVKTENDKYRVKELNNFQYSIQALRNIETLVFKGDKSLPFLNEAVCNIFPFLNKIKKIEGPIDELILKDLARDRNSLAKLSKVQEFKLQIAESTLQENVVQYLKRWMSELVFARKLTLIVTGAEFKIDLSPLNKIEVLEIVYELTDSLPVLANNAYNLEELCLPVSFDWKVNPSDTHNFAVTESFMQSLFKLQNVKKVCQTYSFQDELSILKGCYPIWRDVISGYNFRTIETLNLGVFLNDTIVEKFQTIFIESLRGMHRLRTFGLTLHNDGSASKRFHLTGTILELPKVISTLPCLTDFEFNTEIEIMINILTEFFRGLTQLKNLRKFRSEWLQISQNSFKAFAKRLHQMRNLELLDIHLYSLYDIPKKELDSIFQALGDSLEKMPNLKTLQITADNECFAQEDLWQQWQSELRARCGKKFIELTLAETE